MPLVSRRIALAAASTALLVGPLPTHSPTQASESARGVTLVMQCDVSRPYHSTGFMTINHDVPFPARAKWHEGDVRERSCIYRNPRAKLKVDSTRGAGSMAAMRQRVDRARSRPGFHRIQLHNDGVPFDSHTDHTRIAEFTFLNAKGVRQHVRAVGDKYTLLWVRSSQKAWRNGVGATANQAHRGMNRVITIAM